jgi:hypothetical protein
LRGDVWTWRRKRRVRRRRRMKVRERFCKDRRLMIAVYILMT